MRAEAEGVPPRDMENSDTGPSYIPLGTAFSTASCSKNGINVSKTEAHTDTDKNYKGQYFYILTTCDCTVQCVCGVTLSNLESS